MAKQTRLGVTLSNYPEYLMIKFMSKQTKPPVPQIEYPIFFRSPTGYDFWKIESPVHGHFIRNMIDSKGGYCYQSNNIREGEISLLMKDTTLEEITEKEYLEAARNQMKRNQAAILKISEKLLQL